MRPLEIGPGEHPLPGFDSLDSVPRRGVKYVARWGEEPLPIEACSYTFVFASHVLEHVPWNRTIAALREANRVLRPGGVLEVWVPDFAFIVDCYLRRRCGDRWRRDNPEGDPMLWVNGRVFTYGPGEENWHKACFDARHLRQCLQRAGFVGVERLDRRTRGVSHGAIDLGMRGTKS